MGRKVLLTGGCGFIGHHVAAFLASATDWHIAIIDRLGQDRRGLAKLDQAMRMVRGWRERVTVLPVDISQPVASILSYEIGNVDFVLHLAAESHVTRSILDPEPFVRANVLGTMHVLNYARMQNPPPTFLYFSTDEVFGPAVERPFAPWARYNSCNPYAATKASAEELCLAYANTYGIQTFVTHCCNVFGERQHIEKFVPLCIRALLRGETLKIHTAPNGQAAERYWTYAGNVGSALRYLLDSAAARPVREKYNIGGGVRASVLDMAQIAADTLGVPCRYDLVVPNADRPGNDASYAVDDSALKAEGWRPPYEFCPSLVQTVYWYKDNPQWLNP